MAAAAPEYTRLALSGPLCQPEFVFVRDTLRVPLRLDDPMFGHRTLARLLSISAFTEMLAESMQLQDESIDELYRGYAAVFPGLSPLDAAREKGIMRLFPTLDSHVMRSPSNGAAAVPADSSDQQRTCMDYLQAVSCLNQLLAMAHQLRADAVNPMGQKYIAHQIALLYQCLNIVRGDYSKTLKQRIEKQFDAIKSVTEASGTPQLTEAQREWLLQLTVDVLRYVYKVPATVAPRLLQVTRLLADEK